jgi:restriction system protein
VKIILVSGQQLADLMWEHNIGLSTDVRYEIKKLDIDYFSE